MVQLCTCPAVHEMVELFPVVTRDGLAEMVAYGWRTVTVAIGE